MKTRFRVRLLTNLPVRYGSQRTKHRLGEHQCEVDSAINASSRLITCSASALCRADSRLIVPEAESASVFALSTAVDSNTHAATVLTAQVHHLRPASQRTQVQLDSMPQLAFTAHRGWICCCGPAVRSTAKICSSAVTPFTPVYTGANSGLYQFKGYLQNI